MPNLVLNVPNIAAIISTYNSIKFYRGASDVGPWEEITDATDLPATLTSINSGPYALNGKTLQVQNKSKAVQTVTFSGTDPISIGDTVIAFNTAITQIVASNNAGKLKLSTGGFGTEEYLAIVGGTSLVYLGLAGGQWASGQSARVPLIAGQTIYAFSDPHGQPYHYYIARFYHSGTLAESTEFPVAIEGTTLPEQRAGARSPRGLSLVRKETHTFRQNFLTADGTPLIPIDASKYPSVNVIDINGQIVATSLAVQDGQPGYYKFDFFVPQDAAISSDDRRWRIEWWFIDESGRQVQDVQEFDVRDIDVTATEERDIKYLAMPGEAYRVRIRRQTRPLGITLNVTNADSQTEYALQGGVFPYVGTGVEIHEVADAGTYIYYADIATGSLLSYKSYNAIWSITEKAGSIPEFSYQVIDVPPYKILQYIPSLKMVLDKAQKRLGRMQAYTDSDLYEYLQRGNDIVAWWHPATPGLRLDTFPDGFAHFLLVGASLWGLNAQHLLEVDLNFCLEENSLVRTTRGLVKAKDLVGITQSHLASQLLLTSKDIDIFNTIYDKIGVGQYKTNHIVEICKFDLTPNSLGKTFSKFNLNAFKQGESLWDLEKFWPHLQRYGLMLEEENYPKKLESKYTLCSLDDSRHPQFVWDLGYQQTLKMTTKFGFTETCTKNHGFLALNPDDLSVQWKTLNKLQEGDLIALDIRAEQEKEWEVPFEDLSDIKTANMKEYRLPTQLTPELARLLGYLVSEGCTVAHNQIEFGNSNSVILEQFQKDFSDCFGSDLEYRGFKNLFEGAFGYEEGKPHSDVEYYRHSSVNVRRFLASVGLGYEKSCEKEIPWCILQAPLSLAKEFLKAYFDGDGSIDADKELRFYSCSETLRTQLQALLLRFGIVSTNRWKNECVAVSGRSLVLYDEKVGWLHKSGVVNKGQIKPQKEAVPEDVFVTIKNIRNLLPQVNSRGWYLDKHGDQKQAILGWKETKLRNHFVTWEHVEDWWSQSSKYIEELNPILADRINFLLETKFMWVPITSIEDAGKNHVLDPCLNESEDVLGHSFTANGIVNHNSFSGQTVTLDYDRFSGLESAYSRAIEFFEKTLTPAKTKFFRKTTPAAAFAGRPVRYTGIQNYVYPVANFGSGDYPTLLTQIGLL